MALQARCGDKRHEFRQRNFIETKKRFQREAIRVRATQEAYSGESIYRNPIPPPFYNLAFATTKFFLQ